ncbi:MAG TPA: hypothetical protein VFZ23_06635 [Pyrinomonadaceae bacterium]
MLISLLLVAIAAAGGFAITYLIDDDAPFMWRLAAGNVIGSAVFGSIGFVVALLFGLNPGVVLVALAAASLPLLLFYRKEERNRVWQDWSRAKSRLQGGSTRKFGRFAYYAAFGFLFFFFFDRAMLETAAGIFTGGSQNLGDLPFHLGAIFSFTDANNFPPENPSFAGARFSYPFVADLLSAYAVKLGAGVRDAMFVQNVTWALSLVIVLERFVFLLTNNRLAARIAPVLLILSGGLGFVWFLGDYWAQAKGFFNFISALPNDYTISDNFRWGNSMVVLFMTQRSLLLGMPLTLIVLGYLWKVFAAEATEAPGKTLSRPPHTRIPVSAVITGILAGLLPLIHLHSLAVLFVVGAFLLVLKPERWLTWIAFAAGVGIIAVPELLWSMSGSASETTKFFAWHFGWDKGEKNFFWFWFVNTGLVIPILLAGLYLAGFAQSPKAVKKHDTRKKKKPAVSEKAQSDHSPLTVHRSELLRFYLPFAFLFLVSNAAKLAPWEWDNIKVLIYWFVGSLPFIALVIAWLWQRKETWLKVAAVVCLIILTASGSLDVWRTISGQINYKVFDRDAVEIADQVKLRTPTDAVFLNAPTYNTAAVLTGRQSVMRYPGHLNSHGIDYGTRETDVKQIYQGGATAAALLEKYGIGYVLVSPEERNLGGLNEQFFSRYPITAEVGQYRVYKVK